MTSWGSFRPWEGKREKYSRTGVCLVFSEPALAEEAAKEGWMKQETEQECPHNPTPQEKAIPNYQVDHDPHRAWGHSLGWTPRELGMGRCHKIPRSQQSCPQENVGTCQVLESDSVSEPGLSLPRRGHLSQSSGALSWDASARGRAWAKGSYHYYITVHCCFCPCPTGHLWASLLSVSLEFFE